MVKFQLRKRGISNERLLDAFLKVPRHEFVPQGKKGEAYGDFPLPIGEGQTISQPYIVAYMTELLAPSPEDEVLEIGTGSGYQTAILAELSNEVYTVELRKRLSDKAKDILEELGYGNVHFKVGDGTAGWPEQAPYEGIIGTGGVPQIPSSLKAQLGSGGRLVIPAGSRRNQHIYLLIKKEGSFRREKKIPCSFVPLTGTEGWPQENFG